MVAASVAVDRLAALPPSQPRDMRRLATPQDIEAVHAIYSHEAVLPYLTYERMPLADFGPIYQALLDSGVFFVWEVDGAIAGFYKATRLPGRVSHVVQL